jgi:signal peptidase II
LGWPFVLCMVIIALDQLTKVWTVKASEYSPSLIKVIITDVFNLVHYRNKGAAWGMGSDYTPVLAAISFIFFFYILFEFSKLCENRKINFLAISLLLGGIMGNGIDRAFRPDGVVDMIEVFIPYIYKSGTYRFPAFNIADSAICVGTFLFLIASFFNKKAQKEVPEEKTSES